MKHTFPLIAREFAVIPKTRVPKVKVGVVGEIYVPSTVPLGRVSGTAGAASRWAVSKMAVMASDSSRIAATQAASFSLPYLLRCLARRRA